MFERAASCARFGHRRASSSARLSISRVHFYQSVAKRIVREFNSIANTKLVKDSVELYFHGSLGDRHQAGDLGIVQPGGDVSHDC